MAEAGMEADTKLCYPFVLSSVIPPYPFPCHSSQAVPPELDLAALSPETPSAPPSRNHRRRASIGSLDFRAMRSPTSMPMRLRSRNDSEGSLDISSHDDMHTLASPSFFRNTSGSPSYGLASSESPDPLGRRALDTVSERDPQYDVVVTGAEEGKEEWVQLGTDSVFPRDYQFTDVLRSVANALKLRKSQMEGETVRLKEQLKEAQAAASKHSSAYQRTFTQLMQLQEQCQVSQIVELQEAPLFFIV